jgi:hypothetical protein
MDRTYWHKQLDKPLYPDIVWSRPESRATSGKLAIVGGNAHGFSAPAQAYTYALDAGVGVVNVLMPEAVRKIVQALIPEAEFAPSTPSGSFSKNAIDAALQIALWSDGTLLAGDVGRNSETAMLLETFCRKFSGRLVLTHDVADYFRELPLTVMDRENTLVVVTIAQLQKMFIHTPTITAVTFGMTTPQLVDALHDYTAVHPVAIMTKHNDLIFVAYKGSVSTTKNSDEFWRTKLSARASVYWLQSPHQLFEAVTTSVHGNQEV